MKVFWIGVLSISLITYATRLIPLMFGAAADAAKPRAPWMEALGPCLLAGMMTTVILPQVVHAGSDHSLASFASAVVGASVAMLVRRDPGLATLAGVFGWWLGS